jgi:hypothetical protein
VDNIVRQGDHVINGYKVHVEPALPKPQSTRRSEGGARCSNYIGEGDFGISPAEYHYHGNKIPIMTVFYLYDFRFC